MAWNHPKQDGDEAQNRRNNFHVLRLDFNQYFLLVGFINKATFNHSASDRTDDEEASDYIKSFVGFQNFILCW